MDSFPETSSEEVKPYLPLTSLHFLAFFCSTATLHTHSTTKNQKGIFPPKISSCAQCTRKSAKQGVLATAQNLYISPCFLSFPSRSAQCQQPFTLFCFLSHSNSRVPSQSTSPSSQSLSDRLQTSWSILDEM